MARILDYSTLIERHTRIYLFRENFNMCPKIKIDGTNLVPYFGSGCKLLSRHQPKSNGSDPECVLFTPNIEIPEDSLVQQV